jgi:hypothetical protein
MKGINIPGLIIVSLMLLPNILFAYKNKSFKNKCKNITMNMIEQIGRYGSILLMCIHIDTYESGTLSKEVKVMWLVSSAVLILLYWLYWFIYFSSPQLVSAMMLAAIPSVIFIASGYFLRNWLLTISGAIFCVSHIYVTYQNNRTK